MKSLLSSYGLTSVDEFDKVILDGIEAGAFDPSAVRREVHELLQRLEHQRVDSSFSDAWRLYRSSFCVSADEVASKMSEAFKKAVHTISPTNLNATISLFKGIGRDQEARELLDFYMASRANDGAKFFDLDRHPFGGDVKDADVREAFKVAALAKADTNFDAGETLLNIAKGGWSNEDLTRLSKMAVEDYSKLFKTCEGDDLLVAISQTLKFGQIINATQPMKEIAQKASEALKMIAAESSINRYKIQNYFGVALDGEE